MFVEEYLIELRRERYTPAAFVRYVKRSSAQARLHAYRNPDGVRSVVTNGISFFILFLALSLVVARFLDGALAYRLVIFQGAWIAIGTTWMLLHLGLLRGADGKPLRRIGVPNQLSFFRLLMIPTIYLFIVDGHLGLALGAYFLAGLSDILDGYIARRYGPTSRLGLVLDPIVDVGYVISIFAALHRIGWLPTWLMAIVVLRYTLLFGGGTVIYFLRARVRIRPTAFGRISGIVISAITVALFVLALSGDVERNSGVWRVLTAGLGFLFSAACVQLVVIGVHNLRGGGDLPDDHGSIAAPGSGGSRDA